MGVSQKTILSKMEACLQKAKRSEGSRELREHVRALQALCDVILEDTTQNQSSLTPAVKESDSNRVGASKVELTSKKIETEDGSNGDSLFDF